MKGAPGDRGVNDTQVEEGPAGPPGRKGIPGDPGMKGGWGGGGVPVQQLFP